MSDIRFNQWLHNSGTGGVSQVDGGHVGIGTTNPLIPVGAGVTAVLNVGVVTANYYYGDGSNLSGVQVGGASSLSLNDNIGAYFGNSQDLKIYHDGNHSYIDDQGTGNLRLRSGTLEILNLAGNKTSATFSSGGGQTLNFNNSPRFVTTNTGAVVTGIFTATSSLNVKQSGNAFLNLLSTGSGNAGIYMDASNGDIAGSDYCFIGQDNNLDLVIQANANAGNIDFKRGSSTHVRINTDGDLKVGTTGNSGAKIQIGNHTFAGSNYVYNNNRVGFQNNGSLTCISNCSTYNDGTYPGYGLVLVQGASTSSYNVWGICPDGPAKGNSLNFHYGAQETNIHTPSKRKFEFTGEGYALTPNMPYCMLGRGSQQSVANTTGTKIIFDTKNVDRGSNYNTSNGRFTAPVAGDYLLCLIVEYAPVNGVAAAHTGIWKNGSHNFGYASFDSWNNLGNDNKGGSMVVVANLAQNDYIEFATYHASGSTQYLSNGRTKATIRFLG